MSVSYAFENQVATITVDDGRANAISPDLLKALHEVLDRAEKEADAIVLTGRPGRFSAGFDLGVMKEGGRAVVDMVTGGAELALRLYTYPKPVVAACNGHALAMGAILLLAVDQRLGAAGDFKLGLNEVAIGMTLPVFGVEFAEARLSKRHLQRAVAQAEIYGPEAAADAGFLDRVVPAEDLLALAQAEAQRLASGLSAKAHAETKLRMRAATVERLRASLKNPI